jgi:uncharacterized protein YciI
MINMYFLLFYEVVDDYIHRRRAFRKEHLALAQEAKERGNLVLAGAYGDPPDGAALVFRAEDDSVVRDFTIGFDGSTGALDLLADEVKRWDATQPKRAQCADFRAPCPPGHAGAGRFASGDLGVGRPGR